MAKKGEGNKVVSLKAVESEADQDIMDMLEHLLALAAAGDLRSVAFVGVLTSRAPIDGFIADGIDRMIPAGASVTLQHELATIPAEPLT